MYGSFGKYIESPASTKSLTPETTEVQRDQNKQQTGLNNKTDNGVIISNLYYNTSYSQCSADDDDCVFILIFMTNSTARVTLRNQFQKDN